MATATDATLVETPDTSSHDTLVPDPQVQKWRHRHVDLALGPRPRADQAGMAAAD
jgi:hypothetical protein